MREIFFRGKRLDDGEWVHGFLTVADSETPNQFVIDYLMPRMSCYGQTEVDPETVGQFTGLTDKNGEKIFEDDIVDILTENEEIGVVAYSNGGFFVYADGFCVDFHTNINGTDLEIIGNIHDNPELLEALS